MPPSICIEDEKSVMVVKSFLGVIDNRGEFPAYDIADDAVMDWFGRSVCGRASIIRFVKTHLPKCKHIVDKIVRIPRVSHRLLKQNRKSEIKLCVIEEETSQEDGSGQRTPDNPICPNLEELIKAPKGKKCHWAVDCKNLEFVEIKGSLRYEHTFFDGTTSRLVKRELKKVVLGYSDEIHFIEYGGGLSSCRTNLCKRLIF